MIALQLVFVETDVVQCVCVCVYILRNYKITRENSGRDSIHYLFTAEAPASQPIVMLGQEHIEDTEHIWILYEGFPHDRERQ